MQSLNRKKRPNELVDNELLYLKRKNRGNKVAEYERCDIASEH